MSKQKLHRAPVSIAAFLIAIIIFVLTAWPLKSVALNLFSLPLKISSSFISNAAALITYNSILGENLRLKKELFELTKEVVAAKELTQENERLKKLLSFKERSQFIILGSRVIARSPDNWSRGAIIDKGFKQGIKAGNVVITGLGLAGRVLETSSATSKIILINDPESSVSAIIQRNREDGLICGTLFGGLVMRYLQKDSDVAVGDIVLTSGLTGNYPALILIGKVEKVLDDEQGLGKYCVVRPAVDLKKMEEVLVIIRQ